MLYIGIIIQSQAFLLVYCLIFLYFTMSFTSVFAQTSNTFFEKKIGDDLSESSRIAINYHTDIVYVSNTRNNSVSVIDDSESKFQNYVINVQKSPSDIAINPIKNKIYVVNSDSNTLSVIDGNVNKVSTNITVGETPTSVAVNPETNKIYVVNSNSDNISVLDGSISQVVTNITGFDYPQDIAIDSQANKIYVTNGGEENPLILVVDSKTNQIVGNFSTHSEPEHIVYNLNTNKIYITYFFYYYISVIDVNLEKEIREIPVDGEIEDIAVNPDTNTIYATNYDSLLVIDGIDDKVVEKLNFEGRLNNIAVNPEANKIYVVNSDSNTLSVIDAELLNLVKNIPLGISVSSLSVNPITNMVYISNLDSSNVLIMDGKSDKLIFPKHTFLNVSPPSAGNIVCNGESRITNQKYILPFNSFCFVDVNQGFQFTSWTQNFGDNSSRTIKSSTAGNYFVDYIMDIFDLDPKDTFTQLNITNSGNYTANFAKIPPPIPSEYWIPLYGIIVTTIVGWSIPSIIGWTRNKKDVRNLNHYHQRMKSLYDDGKLDESDLEPLDKLKTDITDVYSKGKINEKHYERLNNEISISYEEIFRKRAKSLITIIDKNVMNERAQQLKDDIENAYSKQKITETQFNMLNKKIADLGNKGYGRRSARWE